MMQAKEYPVIDNHAGIFYHITITTYVLARLLESNVRFELSIENGNAHPFDDIVVSYEQNQEITTKLIQCKSKENGKFYEDDLTADKKSFSLSKYLRGFHNTIRGNYSDHNYDVIMCTNAVCLSSNVFITESTSKDLLTNDPDVIAVNSFTKYFKDSYKSICYGDMKGGCEEFFRKLKFWNTKNTKEMKKVILDELRKLYDGDMVEYFYYCLRDIYETMLEDVKVSTSPRNTNRNTMSITHEYLYDLERKLIKEHNGRIWFRVSDPVNDFFGMENILEKVKKCGNLAVIVGREGVGKTQVALKYATENNKYDHCIFLDAKDDDAMKESIRKLAFQKLRIRNKDYDGNLKDIWSVLVEINGYFEGSNTIFIFDDAKEDITFLSIFKNQKVIITTREEKLSHEPKIYLEGFSTEEAIDYIGMYCPEESWKDAADLAGFCFLNPKKLHEAVNVISNLNEMRNMFGSNFTIEEYLETAERKAGSSYCWNNIAGTEFEE